MKFKNEHAEQTRKQLLLFKLYPTCFCAISIDCGQLIEDDEVSYF